MVAGSSTEGVLHFKRSQVFNMGIYTFPIDDGTLLNLRIDDGRMRKIRGISKLDTFEKQNVFYGYLHNSNGEKQRLFELTYKEPDMNFTHLQTIDSSDKAIVSSSCPFFIIRKGSEDTSLLLRFDEEHKKVGGVPVEGIEFQSLQDFVLYKHYLYCRHNIFGSEITVTRFDLRGEKPQIVWKEDKTCCSNFFLDEKQDRLCFMSNRALVVIDNGTLDVSKIETDIPYRPFYRIIALSDGELTLWTKREMIELWTTKLPDCATTSSSFVQKKRSVEGTSENYDNRIRELESRVEAMERNMRGEERRRIDNYLNDIE
ncbi:hypothetical protein PFISCL1PPCAC_19006 [Pristionchus fissidentatus]|uniref:Uncharacterized protein n=1 Tax=Pristionchus fissidentatus TaxID=1538716 RepID=A0AAV5W6W4_9BILA|nr:hypothetical protein PFISCL1PPCAC_19006 [Pristionchus fissidentatus]